MGTSCNRDIQELMDFAMAAAREAGEQALKYYGRGRSGVAFDETLVTEAELHLDEVLRSQLGSRFPEHSLFQNHQPDAAYSHEGKRYLWIYDPLDGVANFQAGIPVWGMSLALLENFWPVLGLFYMPATRDLFHARAGNRAFWGARHIHIASRDDLSDESVLFTYSRFHETYGSTFPGKIRNLGSTVAHICYVAAGRATAALVSQEAFQDLAAARVILEAAGGCFHKLDGGEFFLNEYLDGERIDQPLLAAGPRNFRLVSAHVQPHG